VRIAIFGKAQKFAERVVNFDRLVSL
jgi:hypothetical protein